MINPTQIRTHFPALSRMHDGKPMVYFDGPGGTQVTQSCIDAITDYLCRCNANHGGVFATAVESDQFVAEAHECMADFLNARDAGEVVFGQNMTSLTFALSRAIGQTLQPGDEIILTRLDHDANFTPWKLMARDRAVTVHVVDIDETDCTLKLPDYERFIGPRTRLLAMGYASNAVGTINPLHKIVGMAKAAGAMTFVDAVHYAPHGPIDVQALGCDFLACSPYKFFAPHLGTVYGRRELLETLPAYKVRPADPHLPSKFETGTQSHESMAGLTGTMKYLAWLGETYGDDDSSVTPVGPFRAARAATLHRAMRAIQAYEQTLKAYALDGLQSLRGVRIYGITDRNRMDERVPTFAIRVEGQHPEATARHLATRGIAVWSGNYYAINLTDRLGVEESGGMVRIGLTHYNTCEEVDRLIDALREVTQ
jgi:cysteine desulfurase family protein (TIGR01976 family)